MQASDLREQSGVGCREDTLKGLLQHSGGSPEKRLNVPEWQEVIVAGTLTGHSQTVAECPLAQVKTSKTRVPL